MLGFLLLPLVARTLLADFDGPGREISLAGTLVKGAGAFAVGALTLAGGTAAVAGGAKVAGEVLSTAEDFAGLGVEGHEDEPFTLGD